MAEEAKALSASMENLRVAIQQCASPPRAALCGFDLWIEAISSPHMSMINFKPGGLLADGSEDEKSLIVPVASLGGRIVISFDPAQRPDGFELRA